MGYFVATDHTIVGFNQDIMGLFDAKTGGSPIVTATRTAGTWTIHADGIDDVTVDGSADRSDVMTAMETQALAKLGPSSPDGKGWTAQRPRELAAMP